MSEREIFQNIPREQRLCKLCNLKHVESEYHFYNAITQNNCFVKGLHKYDVCLVEEKKKTHLN